MRQIAVREQVPVLPAIPLEQEELNLPPAEWFRGVWYAEQKKMEMRAAEEARREKIRSILAKVGFYAAGLAVMFGAFAGYMALLILIGE